MPAVAGAGQLTVWWWNARRAATGVEHNLWFMGDAAWSPPLGWWWWVGVVVLGAAALARALVAPRRGESADARA